MHYCFIFYESLFRFVRLSLWLYRNGLIRVEELLRNIVLSGIQCKFSLVNRRAFSPCRFSAWTFFSSLFSLFYKLPYELIFFYEHNELFHTYIHRCVQITKLYTDQNQLCYEWLREIEADNHVPKLSCSRFACVCRCSRCP